MKVLHCSSMSALMLLVASCQSSPPTASAIKADDEHCYSGFVREISSLVPNDAKKCGIFSSDDAAPATKCAKAAVKSQKPFIFGYQSFGDDSMYCHVAARDANGQLLDVFYDAGMIGTSNEHAFIQISRCKTISFRPGTIGIGSFFDTDECTDAPDIVQAIIAGRHGE